MRFPVATGAIVLTMMLGGVATADSIWARREPRSAFLFEDLRARRVGDLLTIVINENTTANEREQKALARTATTANSFTYKGSSSAGQSVSRSGAAALEIDGSSNRTFTGSAQYTSGRAFTDQVTVSVIDVKPNGNLVVAGYRYRVISGETRVIRVTGEIRVADIGVDNSVISNVVANFQMTYMGRGPQTSFETQGFFGRAMNLVWPF